MLSPKLCLLISLKTSPIKKFQSSFAKKPRARISNEHDKGGVKSILIKVSKVKKVLCYRIVLTLNGEDSHVYYIGNLSLIEFILYFTYDWIMLSNPDQIIL